MMINTRGICGLAWALIASLAAGSVTAQSLAPGQVAGSEMTAWIAADGFAVGGVNLANGCTFLARHLGSGRWQSIHCTDREPFIVQGEGRVEGNQFCSKFSYPDGSRLDLCQDLFKVGDNKYEFRAQGAVRSVVYRLIR